MIDESLTDRIYEAAFVPEFWPDVLHTLAEMTSSAAGTFCVLGDRGRSAKYTATDFVQPVMDDIEAAGEWQTSDEVRSMFSLLPPSSFIYDADYFPKEILETNHMRIDRVRPLGIGGQIGYFVALPADEVMLFTMERWLHKDRPSAEDLACLDAVRPHLARAGLTAARLRLERAQTTVSTLEALGIPAAVMALTGRVRASNPLFETVSDRLRPAAFGGIALVHASADALFQEAVTNARRSDGPVRSIPIPAVDGRSAIIVHVLPLLRSAYDIFSGSDVLVAVTEAVRDAPGPSTSLLSGLFDLTAAEARLSSSLAAGKTLQQAAELQGIRISTARAYLAQVFHKTGTQQQSQLVALLKGTQTF
ncbi:helix-turn-helix transcriptional regulator [Bradyrhizobium amphicarpaeae]|uniref:helix-turn-helix transcriptional regulator n=1 Tax=Bradyrhizobium amphicarpaeae TaxID=1404768 RepID=UPI000B9FDD44|nr:helix-turn-helix transcriptional regulator [Bradyrhizobium amphicarpaeae]